MAASERGSGERPPGAEPPKRRRVAAAAGRALAATSDEAKLEGLLAWLRGQGAKLDGLCFKPDIWGGIGAFAKHEFLPDDVLATVPRHCILTAEIAVRSELGQAVTSAARHWGCSGLCTDELILWIFMCAGRHDVRNPFHAYLAALPATSPDPACWSAELWAELRSTPVGSSLRQARQQVQECYDRFVRLLPEHLPQLLPEHCLGSVHDLLWARGMCISRAFNTQDLLSPSNARAASIGLVGSRDSSGTSIKTDGSVISVLLPLLDLLNHRPGQPTAWVADDETMRFRTGEPLQCGDEVFNDYGAKSNEDLLFSHGFCLRDNPMDAVPIWLPNASESQQTLTRFMVRRRQEGGVPTELWRALARQQDAPGTDADSQRQPLVIGVQHVLALATALKDKLQYEPLRLTEAEDVRRLECKRPSTGGDEDRRRFIAMYRQGTRDVLREAIASLSELLV